MNSFAGFSAAHPLGTDDLGRDVVCRLLYGARASLSVAVMANMLGLSVGLLLGSIAGYFGGMTDNIIMRFFDILQSIPGILLSIIMTVALGNKPINLTIALSVGTVSGFARILRAQILSIRQMEYIEAAKATNCGIPRIIFKYILPNCLSPLIVAVTGRIPGTLLAISALAFIGLGIQPPTPEWGSMLSSGKEYIRNYPLLIISPGIAILITVLSLNMIGDGLRDALDPKLKH
jgi:peptide/nickel transport system permease protein